MTVTESFNTVDWKPLDALSRRIGQRYGFASTALNRSDVALLGGVVHFDLSLSQSAKGDLERGNPIPFSQVHCVGNVKNGASFSCTLLSVKPTTQLPCPRLYHSASRLNEQSVIVFGGQAFNDKRKLADIWSLDVSSSPGDEEKFQGEWSEVSPASRSTAFPPPRSKHAVSTAGNNTLIVSGGCGFEETVLGDLWVAHIEGVADNKCVVWKKVNSPIGKLPPPRKSHAISPMVSEIELMLHGGIDGNGNHLSDLWICQFVNEEKSRCVWTELVKSPHPRSGHILFPSFVADDPKGDRYMMVFGGNQAAAAKYNIDTGVWSMCAFKEGLGLTLTATELDVVYQDGEDPMEFPVPSVLMIPDTVIRSSQSSPWLGLIFPMDISQTDPPSQVKEEEEKMQSSSSSAAPSLVESYASYRRAEYRAWANQLPPLPLNAHETAGNDSCILAVLPTSPTPRAIYGFSQSPFFAIDQISRFLWQQGDISVASWAALNPYKCHVLVTSFSDPLVSNFQEFNEFVNSPNTAKAVAEVANSCFIVSKSSTGERFIGFISDILHRHSASPSSPVISVTQTPYAQVQATMKVLMRYTPFSSPAALEELFGLFHGKSAGFLLIDFDGESESKSVSQKTVAAKDNGLFWYEALRALQSPRPRVEAYALTNMHETRFSVNGTRPTADFASVLKSKLLTNVVEKKIGKSGPSLVLGKMKDAAPNVGVLVYSNGSLVRHIRGRFPFEEEVTDELKQSVNQVTGVIDVEDLLTPVDGPLSDFQEAIDKSPEWSEFVLKLEEACFVYLGGR